MSFPTLRRYGRPALLAVALLMLSGCVAYPDYGYAGYPGYSYPAYAYAGPPVVVGGWWGWHGGGCCWRGGGWHR